MKSKAYRAIVLAAGLMAGVAACTDVTTEPKSDISEGALFSDPSSYRAFLAKLYGGLSVTGQQGPAGNGDVGGIDEGFSQYVRQLWQLQELPTDEAIIAWGDDGLPALNTQQWSASNPFVTALYYRIFFQVALVNDFMRQTTDAKLSSRGVTAELRATVKQYRAEARFLRALSYAHALDLYGNVPIVTEDYAGGVDAPPQATRQQVYDFVVKELNEILPELPAMGKAQYGRADQGAVRMTLAKVYLNAGVYTGTPRYAEARAQAEAVINSGAYQLDSNFLRIFSADNNTSPEMIFPVPYDGQATRTFGGTTFLVHASVGGALKPADYGIDGGWYGLRTRPEAYALFPSADKRGSFFVKQETTDITSISDFSKGVAAPKYRNVSSTGKPGSSETFPDTDYPMFRLGEAYLTAAEAILRGGGGTRADALKYVNALRQRAYGDASGNIADADLTLPFILDERGRELFWEATRRTDLIRFGRFSDQGVWQWKGGVQPGKTTAATLNLYPIPAAELAANPKMKQNPGY